MANRTAADVGLGHLGDRHRREHTGVNAHLLQCVLESERVEHGGEHAHVVGGGPVHSLGRTLEAAVDVPGADHDRHLDLAVADLADLVRDPLDLVRVGAVVEVAHQRLPGELQQDPAELSRSQVAYSCPTSKRAKRAIRTFSPVFAATSVRRSSIVLP
jgi:hypothetical protein